MDETRQPSSPLPPIRRILSLDPARQMQPWSRPILEGLALAGLLWGYTYRIAYWPLPVAILWSIVLFALSFPARITFQRLALITLALGVGIPFLSEWQALGAIWILSIAMSAPIYVQKRDDFSAFLLVLSGPILVQCHAAFLVPLLAGIWYGARRGATIAGTSSVLTLLWGLILNQPVLGQVFVIGKASAVIGQSAAGFPLQGAEALRTWEQVLQSSNFVGLLQVALWIGLAYLTAAVSARWTPVLGTMVTTVVWVSIQIVIFLLGSTTISALGMLAGVGVSVIGALILATGAVLPSYPPASPQAQDRLKALDGFLVQQISPIRRVVSFLLIGWFVWRLLQTFSSWQPEVNAGIALFLALMAALSLSTDLILLALGVVFFCGWRYLPLGIVSLILVAICLLGLILASSVKRRIRGEYIALACVAATLTTATGFGAMFPIVIALEGGIPSEQGKVEGHLLFRGALMGGIVFILSWFVGTLVGTEATPVLVPAPDIGNAMARVISLTRSGVSLASGWREAGDFLGTIGQAFLGMPLVQLILWIIVPTIALYLYTQLGQLNAEKSVAPLLTIAANSILLEIAYWIAFTSLGKDWSVPVFIAIWTVLLNAVGGWVIWRYLHAEFWLAPDRSGQH